MVSKRVDLEGRQRGNGIKIVAYAPGCKIQRIDLALPKTCSLSRAAQRNPCGTNQTGRNATRGEWPASRIRQRRRRGFRMLGTKAPIRGTDGPFRNNRGRRRMSRMRALLLPSFNMFYILACGAMAWFAVRRHLLR